MVRMIYLTFSLDVGLNCRLNLLTLRLHYFFLEHSKEVYHGRGRGDEPSQGKIVVRYAAGTWQSALPEK